MNNEVVLSQEEKDFIDYLRNNPRVKMTTRTVFITDDFDVFKHSPFNRKVSDKKVNDFMEQDLKDVIYTVNGKGEILDGQHRIEACRRKGQPVTFEVIFGADDFYMAEVNKIGSKWSPQEFIRYYAEKGLLDYQVADKLVNQLKKIGISFILNAALCPINQKKISVSQFISGGHLIFRGNPYRAIEVMDFYNEVKYSSSFKILLDNNTFKDSFMNFGFFVSNASDLGMDFEHFKCAFANNLKDMMKLIDKYSGNITEALQHIYNLKNGQNKPPKTKITKELKETYFKNRTAGKYRDEEVLKQFLNDTTI